MTTEDEQAQAGTVEGQGPVEVDEEMARHLENKRDELFEKFEIRDGFPEAVMQEAETRTEGVQQEIQNEVDERRDLRDLTTWTTDPIDAQDFDDAISVEKRDDEYVLWVHIADVTHYVTPDTAMWEEAVERGNTVYLPDYTIHMLPPVLAETVCSLVPNEDRLAHTVEMHLDPETLSYEDIDIYKSVIESDARLTYSECEEVLDDPETRGAVLVPLGVLLLLYPLVELAERLYGTVPTGLGKGGYIDVGRSDLRGILAEGVEWMESRGHARPEDVTHCEEGGRLPGDPNAVPDDAINRGLSQVGSLGSGNHFLEV
ncbi:hypothetical protein BRD06_09625, partial [Halobacteriales archaeon QS_9_67_15]